MVISEVLLGFGAAKSCGSGTPPEAASPTLSNLRHSIILFYGPLLFVAVVAVVLFVYFYLYSFSFVISYPLLPQAC
jgi:Flp pilus assembly protein TadB